jgi:hypothetical protein
MSGLYDRPDWVRRLNKFGPAVGDPALIVPLDPDEMLELARSATGLHDVGDALWLESYRQRLRSIDRESNATLLGRLLCRAETIRVLQTNLRLRHAWAETPAILDEPIEHPIFVSGAPRTGTSILLELLALDPNLRAPISWEAHHPLSHTERDDRAFRISLAEAEQELWADIQPELMALHELRSDLPCECVHFMALDFAAGYWGMQYATPGYDAWAAEQTGLVERTYRGHRRFLQTLQYGNEPRQWLLKTPGHLMTIEALFAEYPDALIVHTHRDPLKFVASTASTTELLRWLRSDSVDKPAMANMAHLGFGFMLDEVRRLRSEGGVPNERFVDSHYLDLIADPAAAIRKIYHKLGRPWPAGHDETVVRYLRDKPRGKFGTHTYTLEDYGLDPEQVRASYADYVEHYGVVSES